MIDMEFKGITWVGNVYQKFEAICLEVEEVMCQDTVKYVESHVETVSSSVKKFYEDVMQDLLPPSSMDTEEVPVPDGSLNPQDDIEMFNKSKARKKENPIKLDKPVAEDSEKTAGVNENDTLSTSCLGDDRVLPPSSAEEFHDNLDLGFTRISENNNQPSSDTKNSCAPPEKDMNITTLCNKISEDDEGYCERKTVIEELTSVEVSGYGSAEKREICNDVVGGTSSLDGVTTDLLMYDMIQSIEFSGKNESNLRLASSTDKSGGTSTEIYAAENSQVGSPRGSCVTEDTQICEFAERAGETGSIENNDIIKPKMKTIEQFYQLKVEDTCVLVDGEKLFSVSHKEGKQRSYKKKIREAFSSRMKITRKGYEDLAAQCKVDEESNQHYIKNAPPLIKDVNAKNLPALDFCESEWELL